MPEIDKTSIDKLDQYLSSYLDDYANLVNSPYISGLPFGPVSTEFYAFKNSGSICLKPGHRYFIDISHNGPSDDSYINVDISIDDLMSEILEKLRAELSAMNELGAEYIGNNAVSTVLSTNLDKRYFITTTDAVIAVQSGCNFTFDVSEKFIIPISSCSTSSIVNTKNAIYSKNIEIDNFSFSADDEGNVTMPPGNSYISFRFEDWRNLNTTFAYFKVIPFSQHAEFGAIDMLTGKPGMTYASPSGVTFSSMASAMRHLTGGIDSYVSVLT